VFCNSLARQRILNIKQNNVSRFSSFLGILPHVLLRLSGSLVTANNTTLRLHSSSATPLSHFYPSQIIFNAQFHNGTEPRSAPLQKYKFPKQVTPAPGHNPTSSVRPKLNTPFNSSQFQTNNSFSTVPRFSNLPP
jgi:hypothetical protein